MSDAFDATEYIAATAKLHCARKVGSIERFAAKDLRNPFGLKRTDRDYQ